MTHVYVRRTDGSVVDIPEKDLHETLKRNKNWSVFTPSQEVVQTVVSHACPLCDFVGKTSSGLRLHKRKHEAHK